MDKLCVKCDTTKPITEFSVDVLRRDGHYTYCKNCERLRMRKYRRTAHGRATVLIHSRSAKQRRAQRFATIKQRSKLQGWLEHLTKAEFYRLFDQPCFYCGGAFGVTTGLDRTNNTKGYILNNVVQCCKECNTIKSNKFSKDEMLAIVKLVLTMRAGQIDRDVVYYLQSKV